MSEFNINNELNKEQNLPNLVEEKWENTKQLIISGKVTRDKKQSKTLPLVLKSTGALAASFAVMLTVGFHNPAFAESVPFIDSIVGYFRDAGTSDTIINVTDVDNRVTPAIESDDTIEYADEASFTVNEVYSDGNVLVFSYTLDATLDTKDYDMVSAKAKIKVNDISLNADPSAVYLSETFSLTLYNTEDGKYIGTQTINIHDYLADLEKFELEVVVDELVYSEQTAFIPSYLAHDKYVNENGETVIDEPYMTEEEFLSKVETLNPRELKEKGYTIYSYPLPVSETIEPVSFKGEVEIDTSDNKEYDVSFNENGYSITKLVTSPLNTYIEYNTPKDVYMDVYDNFGNLISDINDINSTFGKRFMFPLFEDTTELTFNFYPKSDVNDVTSYTVSVDGGYITEEDYENRYNYNGNIKRYSEEDVTFTPDIRHLYEEYTDRFEGDVIVNLGETITVNSYDYEQCLEQGASETNTATQDITLSNMQVFDSISDSGINLSDTLSSADYINGAKFITIDISIKNNNALGYSYDGVGDNTFGITQFVRPSLKDYSADTILSEVNTEIEYFSIPNDTASGYYMFQMDKDGEINATVGFFYDEELLNDGNIQFMIGDSEFVGGDEMFDDFYYIYDVPAIS